jgi:hypothetical protein
MSEMSGMESGSQENVGGMPAGAEPHNPSGQTMPTDGGTDSSASPAPGDVASPGPDDYVMEPNVLNTFASMPTPDN